jgi:hypothetical protein
MPDARSLLSRISVLGAFKSVQHRPEFTITRSLVLFECVGFAGEFCYAPGEAGTTPGGEDTPAEEPVGAFEVIIRFFIFQQVLEQGVQGFCFIESQA